MKFKLTSQPVNPTLSRGQTLDMGLEGGVWQLTNGLLLIGSLKAKNSSAWRLALPGDWLNIEALCGLPPHTCVTALAACSLSMVPTFQHEDTESSLRRLVRQQQRWAVHLLGLRSGPVEARIERLLALAGGAGMALDDEVRARQLPALRDIATLIDAAPETVCRVLARLRPSHAVPRRVHRRADSVAALTGRAAVMAWS